MAEGVLSNFAGELLGKLSTEALKQLGMLLGLKDDLKKLKSNVSAIQAVLADAEERPNKSRSLKDWLQKLGEALYDADDLLDEISTEALRRQAMTRGKHAKQVRIFFSRYNQLAFNYRMSRKIKIMRESVDEISAEKQKFGLIENSEPRMIQHDSLSSHQIGTHSALNVDEVIGRDGDKVYIKRLLLDMDHVKHHNVSFIAIVGMGGMGKTTLAKLLYNDTQLSNYFDLKMGKKILETCKGVPLVIKHIGRLLYSRFSKEEWISFKNDELCRVTQENNDMTNILALSYKHLPPHLKQCFAYSSLYTKNDYIDKDQLLKQWVAHGFVPSRDGSKFTEDIANDYFTELCWRFFYEHYQDNYGVRMHDMMHDLAKMVAGSANIYHFSLGHDVKSWNDFPHELLKAKGLRTLCQ